MSDNAQSSGSGWWRRWWTEKKRPGWIVLVVPMMLILVVVLGVVIWLALPSVHFQGSPALPSDIFERALDDATKRNANNFALWYKANIIIQFTLILAALLATVFASVTTKENAETIKKIYRIAYGDNGYPCVCSIYISHPREYRNVHKIRPEILVC